MGNRKLPFGYKMEMGEIVLHPQEAKLVEQIFRQYIAGGTYGTLVAGLRDQPISYDEGKIWNKNMVARILEDSRYTGENGYPAIIQEETLGRALEKRSTRQATIQVTEAQKILRRLSGCTTTKRVERQVLGLLNTLIRNPERIVPPKTSVQTNEPQLQRELDTVMACQPINEDSAQMGARFRVNHHSWWKQELPSPAEYEEARRNLERVNYEVDYIITHCAPNGIVDKLGDGDYAHDRLTEFLEEGREKAKFHYWLFGHYHDNKIIDDRFVLLWEQMVQVI